MKQSKQFLVRAAMMLLLTVFTTIDVWAADETRTYMFDCDKNFYSYVVYNGVNYKLSDNLIWRTSNVLDIDGLSFQLNASDQSNTVYVSSSVDNGVYKLCLHSIYCFKFSHATKWIKHVKFYGTKDIFEEDVYSSHSYDSGLKVHYNGQGSCYKVEITLSDDEPVYVPNNIAYIDADGTAKEADSKEITDQTRLTDGWWAVTSDVTIPERIDINGTVNLILCDGAKLIANKGINVYAGNQLNIFGQTNGTGVLEANGQNCTYGSYSRHISGIGGNEFYQEGSGWNVNSLGTITINGGIVNATGLNASAIGEGGRDNGGSVVIAGGKVTANGGIGGDNTTVTLSWMKPSDRITATSYAGTVNLVSRFVLLNEETDATRENIAGKTIAPRFVVTYNPNGAKSSVLTIAKPGATTYELPEPIFEAPFGKSFGGWLIGATTYAAGDPITIDGNIEATAVWDQITHTVSFNLNGHGGDTPADQTVNHGDHAAEPATPSEAGYTFGGWYPQQVYTYNRWVFNAARVMKDETLYAKWTKDAYTISYEMNGGVNDSANPLSYTVDDKFTLVEPTKEGYTFLGWTGTGLEKPEKTITFDATTGNKSYTANWQINQYTVTFDCEGCTPASIAPITADYGTAFELPAPVARKECIFHRWVVDGHEDEAIPTTIPARNITIRPEWYALVHYTYTAPTCTERGIIECYHGNYDRYYSENDDHLTYTEIDRSTVFIPATGHHYINPTWTWRVDNITGEMSAVLDIECETCGRRDADITYTPEAVVTTEPTETTDGVLTYSASFKWGSQVFQNSHEEVIPRLGMVAKIDDTPYSYLYQAIYAAGNDDVITVYSDINENWTTKQAIAGTSKYEIMRDITIDLNNHSVVLEMLPIGANLTIKNGSLKTYINNANVGSDHTLTLDNATFESLGEYDANLDIWNNMQWMADNIAVTNHSKWLFNNQASLGSGYDDFTLTIDETSSVEATNISLSCYNSSRVGSQFAQYLPQNYSVVTEDCYHGYLQYGGSKFTGTVSLKPYNTLALPASPAAGNYWTTFYNSTAGFKIDDEEHAAAYTISIAGDVATLHLLGKVIPAGTPVIIVGEDSEISMTKSTATAENTVTNHLRGFDVAKTISMLNDDYYYGLGTYYVLGRKNGEFGLHIFSGDMLAAHKAFIFLPANAGVRQLTLVFENGVTEISSAKAAAAASDEWYTLDGRRLGSKPAAKGLYIHGGVKVIVK